MRVFGQTDWADVIAGGLARMDKSAYAMHPFAAAGTLHPALGEHFIILATDEEVLTFCFVHTHHLLGITLGTVPPFFAANDVVGGVAENSLTAIAITDIDRGRVLETFISTDQAGITTAGVTGMVVLVGFVLFVTSAYFL